ncbi:MAG: DUF3300 domain-containing protein [Acetobacteraceae bacterium]|nr:DUF3300 domain-containing protein [Acetobacteraceae bacterium]
MNTPFQITARHGLAILLSASLLSQPGCAPVESSGASQGTGSSTGLLQSSRAPDPSHFSAEQLDALLAPIALYPDVLPMPMLTATTYPEQIVEAERWSASNRGLSGERVAEELKPLPWEPSVKSLVPFPQGLQLMDQHPEWTQLIAYAMAVQQQDVLDSVQRLRRRALIAGTLKTTDQQVVTVLPSADKGDASQPGQSIVIQPADPQTVYIPIYNPTLAYGAWRYQPYPPTYVGGGLGYSAGFAIGAARWGWAGPIWGYTCCVGGGSGSMLHAQRGNSHGSSRRSGSGGGSSHGGGSHGGGHR